MTVRINLNLAAAEVEITAPDMELAIVEARVLGIELKQEG